MNVSSLQITDIVFGRLIALLTRGSVLLEIMLLEFYLVLFHCHHNSVYALDHQVLLIEIRRKLQILFRYTFHYLSAYGWSGHMQNM